MPAKGKELMRAAERLGFAKARQKGSHPRWIRPDGRATTIPRYGVLHPFERRLYDAVPSNAQLKHRPAFRTVEIETKKEAARSKLAFADRVFFE
jgi:predicted RNA binding protein YcfA (HicA-like mRNA interferase family)